MTTKPNKRVAMLAAITRHGESLLAAFPNATERNPDTLARKLRRLETKIGKPVLDYCNGDNGVTCEAVDAECVAILAKVRALLGLTEDAAKACGLFVNRDPRGYALKVDDAWARRWNADASASFPRLHTDMGGYGILAPDLTEGGS